MAASRSHADKPRHTHEAGRGRPGPARRTPAPHPSHADVASGTGMPEGARILALQHAAGNRAVARMIAQRVLNDGERGPLATRCLQLETRIETAVGLIPDVVRRGQGDHAVIEPIRAELRRVRAPFGNDDAADITSKLNGYEAEIATVEAHINTHLPQLQQLGQVWTTFAGELGDLDPDRVLIARNLYRAKATEYEIDALDRKMQRTVAMDSKAMSALRKQNAQLAMDRVGQYVTSGYVGIDTLNSFYASSYDSAEDDFGAAASLTNNTSSGAFQWLREWEFHIHASVTRAGGKGTPVTGFTIKTGHIKPTSVARDTGTSITVPAGMHAGVIATSAPAVIRWANGNRSGPVLRKL